LQQAGGVRQPFFSYPLQGPQLEPGKRYVWQVIARDRMQYACKSEIWTFRTGDKTLTAADNLVYLVLDGKTTGRETIAPDMLHLKYTAMTAAHTAILVLKTADGKTVTTTKVSLRQGDNYLHIPLSSSFQSKHNYAAALQEPDGSTIAAAFTIK